jgi:hypothetical protein
VVVSGDGGLTWDQARNLTNTYTPGCDSATGIGGACDNDHWPSMNEFGRNVALNPGDTATEVIIPTGGADLGWYLDVQYINDKSAGGIVQDEGTWQQADVKWFRLACVEEIENPLLGYLPSIIDYPAWGKPGVQKDTNVTLENLGNATLNYTIVEEEDTGTPGWLATSGFSGTVPAGIANTETGTVSLNNGGVETNVITLLQGRLIFNSNAPTTPDTLSIRYWVADTLYSGDRYHLHGLPEPGSAEQW